MPGLSAAVFLTRVIKSDYPGSVTASELQKKLKKHGATFTNGSKHTIVTLNGKIATIPRHKSKEIKTGTLNGILKQLGIKEL